MVSWHPEEILLCIIQHRCLWLIDRECSSGSSLGEREAMLLCPHIMFINGTVKLFMDSSYSLYMAKKKWVGYIHLLVLKQLVLNEFSFFMSIDIRFKDLYSLLMLVQHSPSFIRLFCLHTSSLVFLGIFLWTNPFTIVHKCIYMSSSGHIHNYTKFINKYMV